MFEYFSSASYLEAMQDANRLDVMVVAPILACLAAIAVGLTLASAIQAEEKRNRNFNLIFSTIFAAIASILTLCCAISPYGTNFWPAIVIMPVATLATTLFMKQKLWETFYIPHPLLFIGNENDTVH